jgi:signal transduction histidine kinase
MKAQHAGPAAVASIHRRVLLWAMGALAVGACLLVGGSWYWLDQEMNEVFEDNLKQVALAVASHHNTSGTNGEARPPRLAQQLPRIYEEFGHFEFLTQVWTQNGRRLYSSDDSIALPLVSRSGMSTVTAGGEPWHVYTIVLDDGTVQAAQRARERDSLARETASTMVPPALLMLALAAVLLTLALRRALAPISLAAGEVTARNVEALHPIPLASQPAELHLLVSAINDLMARLGSALAQQRNFVADAAHELRTPIAALRLQLQLLERAGDDAQRTIAMAELAAGVARTQHLVEQLLQLSRLGPEAPPLQRQPVSLAQLARSAVSTFSARAEAQGVDLGAEVQAPAEVAGDPQQLAILLNNLITNALRHTPAGGRIDVIAGTDNGAPMLAVRDTGPGIAPGERLRVFDRFYRLAGASADPAAAPAQPSGTPEAAAVLPQPESGSGLGLAIVKAVAERHGAQAHLSDAPGGGLLVTITFASPGPDRPPPA